MNNCCTNDIKIMLFLVFLRTICGSTNLTPRFVCLMSYVQILFICQFDGQTNKNRELIHHDRLSLITTITIVLYLQIQNLIITLIPHSLGLLTHEQICFIHKNTIKRKSAHVFFVLSSRRHYIWLFDFNHNRNTHFN